MVSAVSGLTSGLRSACLLLLDEAAGDEASDRDSSGECLLSPSLAA